MVALTKLRLNEDVVTSGKLFDVEGIKFKLAHAGVDNKAYVSAEEEAMRPYRKKAQKGDISSDLFREILMPVYLKYIVKGMTELEDENGVNIPFSAENVKKVFEEFPSIFSEIIALASDRANFLGGASSDAKNS